MMHNNQVEIMTAAPHLILTGEHGSGKSVLLDGLTKRLMKNERNMVVVSDGGKLNPSERQDVSQVFDERMTKIHEMVEDVERVFGGEQDRLTEPQRSYQRMRNQLLMQSFSDVWLVIDDFDALKNDMMFMAKLLTVGNQVNIHVALAIHGSSRIHQHGLRMDTVRLCDWYRAVGAYRFEFVDIAEWSR